MHNDDYFFELEPIMTKADDDALIRAIVLQIVRRDSTFVACLIGKMADVFINWQHHFKDFNSTSAASHLLDAQDIVHNIVE